MNTAILSQIQESPPIFEIKSMSTNTNLNYIIPLTHQSGIIVNGSEAKKFLQGQITCNIDEVTQSHAQLAAHCTAKGWVVSLFDVLQMAEDSFFLRMPTDLCSKAKQALGKYALFSKVTLTENKNWTLLGMVGPQALDILKSSLKQDIPHLAPQDSAVLSLDQDKIVIFREIGTIPRYVLLLPESLLTTYVPHLKQQTEPLSINAWDLWDVQMGIPCLYPQTSEMALAPYFNLEALNAISYDKGCYVGQEVIARMHYRGKVKKHMYRAKVAASTPPISGMEIGSNPEKSEGFVVRVAQSESNEYELLVIIDDELSTLENSFLLTEEQPKLKRLELPYSFKA